MTAVPTSDLKNAADDVEGEGSSDITILPTGPSCDMAC